MWTETLLKDSKIYLLAFSYDLKAFHGPFLVAVVRGSMLGLYVGENSEKLY